jgi:hypothetical protein
MNAPEPALTTNVPMLAGRYQLLDQLGQGGMGAVFRALDVSLGRHVAVKVLPAGKLADADAVARFRREAMALARLSHPGIVQAHDSGQDGERHFLVMELVEGRSLAAILAEQGRIAPTRAADVGHQAARALGHAHKSGLIHRDVKPSNLLLMADGTVKLLDLGLARFLQDQLGDASLTHTGAGMGTPDYCAPEQFRNAHSADPRADVYSLGCTLYHLIGGRVPFPGSSLSEKMKAHERQQPTPLEELCPEVPAGLALVVQRMMAKRPQDRFRSMAEVAEALAPYVAGSSASFQEMRTTVTWDGSQLTTALRRSGRRRSILVLVAGVVLGVLMAGGVAVLGARQGWFRGTETEVALGGSAEGEEPKDQKPGTEPKKGPPKKTAPATEDEPGVLTVSRKPEGGGKYRSITAALKEVKPGQTIRVLDDAVYRESLALNVPARHEGMTLEAVGGATLETTTPTLVEIDGVANLTVRGFRLRATDVTVGKRGAVLVLIQGSCPGLVLERLQAQTNRKGSYTGILFDASMNAVAGLPPALVRRCSFREAHVAVLLAGASSDLSTPRPVGGVAIRDNLIENPANAGVQLQGSLREIQVVGNRIRGQGLNAGFLLLQLFPQTRAILLANNTVFNSGACCVLQADAPRGKDIQVRNNLFLVSRRPDLIFTEMLRPPAAPRPRDGKMLLEAWRMDHNWREGQPPSGTDPLSQGWVPRAARDVLRKSIAGVNRDPKDPEKFLRPDKDSPLASKGAGQDDPTLPSYVGAVPPEGVEPWDWDRAWRIPKEAKLLTVSKQADHGGKYRCIRDALKDATPWDTIRVLDAETYDETIRLTDAEKHTGLTLEAPKGATLRLVEPAVRLLTIRDVPHVCIRGFILTDDGVGKALSRAFAFVRGNVPGVVLSQLHLRPSNPMLGVCIQNANVAPGQQPLRVVRCVILPKCAQSSDGIVATGSGSGEPCRGVRLEGNQVRRCFRGIVLSGLLRDVHAVGNLVVGGRATGLQVENLPPASRGVLFANNTVFNCLACLRIWDDLPAPEHRARQVEFVNNLIFDASACDVGYVEVSPQEKQRPGNGKALLRLWRFHHNCRDHSGTVGQLGLPAGQGDARFRRADLLAIDTKDLTRTRPKKGSALATQGAGAKGGDLPAYIGALPPEGGTAWDWDRTWRARRSK